MSKKSSGGKHPASRAAAGFTLLEAQALVGCSVHAKRKGGWQIKDGVVLEHHHTGTVIGVDGEYTTHGEPSRIVLAVQIWPPAKRRRKKPRDFILRLDGRVVGHTPIEEGLDPLPFVLVLDKSTFETYLSLTS